MTELWQDLSFLGLFLLLGGGIFPRWVLRVPPRHGRTVMAWAATSAGFALVWAATLMQTASDVNELTGAVDVNAVIGYLHETHIGHVRTLRLLTALIFLLIEIARSYTGRVDRFFFPIGGLAVLATFTLSGHGGADLKAPTGIAIAFLDFTHLTAAVTWGGTLLYLTYSRWTDEVTSHLSAAVGPAEIRRFSHIATVCVGVFLPAGALLAWLHAQSWDALTNGTWGRALDYKVGLVAALLLIAAYNRCLVHRHSLTLTRLHWLVAAETILLLFVLRFSGALTTSDPPQISKRADVVRGTAVDDLWRVRVGRRVVANEVVMPGDYDRAHRSFDAHAIVAAVDAHLTRRAA